MNGDYKYLQLRNQLCFPVYLCSKELIRKYTPLLKKINLTYTQYIVMLFFWEKHKSNVKELGETLLLDPSTLTPLLKKLEEKGFVKRVRSKIDERNLIISLTKKGEALKEKALGIPETIGDSLNLSDDEVKVLQSLVYKVLYNVERKDE